MVIKYVQGNAIEPDLTTAELNIIVHCVNDIGVMGSGIAYGIAKKWPHVKLRYEDLFQLPANKRATAQGNIQIIRTEANKNLFVCNLFGQSETGYFEYLPAVRYGAIEEGFLRLRNRLNKALGSSCLHLPRIGCGLAGGSWSRIEDILNRVFRGPNPSSIGIVVYDFPGSTFNP